MYFQQEKAESVGIEVLPTFKFYKNGTEVAVSSSISLVYLSNLIYCFVGTISFPQRELSVLA